MKRASQIPLQPVNVHQWRGYITLLSPLSHISDESSGTGVRLRRVKIQAENGTRLVPMYSGNAFRGKLRRLAARDFLRRIGLYDSEQRTISDKLYYTLFGGGGLQKGSGNSRIDIGAKRELRQMIPPLSLLGTAILNQMPQGKLGVGVAWPIARETSAVTGHDSDISVWDLVEFVFYTRRDDLEDKAAGGDPHQMLYRVECLSTGAVMSHEFTLEEPTEIELSCFGAMMAAFNERPQLGGKRGTGHGSVRLDYEPQWPDPTAYYEWLAANRDDIVAYVRRLEAALK